MSEIKKIPDEIISKLKTKIPDWAIKPHPTKSNMTVIHPMAIIDRLNDCFGIGAWNFKTREIDCTKEIQKTKSGDRTVYMSSVHGTLLIPEYAVDIDQYGGSTNDDKGDALKGGATDALTKIASYLGIGAEIYKGQGNKDGKTTPPKLSLFEKTKLFIEKAKVDKLMETADKLKNAKEFSAEEKTTLLNLIDSKLNK